MKGGEIMNNKKGLSDVVTALIIILLVLVALGIVWVVIRNLIDSSSGQIDTLSQCPLINVNIVSAVYDPVADKLNVTVERAAGGGDINGVLVVASDGTTSASNDTVDLNELDRKTAVISMSTTPTSVTVAPYFTVNGERQVCSTSETSDDITTL